MRVITVCMVHLLDTTKTGVPLPIGFDSTFIPIIITSNDQIPLVLTPYTVSRLLSVVSTPPQTIQQKQQQPQSAPTPPTTHNQADAVSVSPLESSLQQSVGTMSLQPTPNASQEQQEEYREDDDEEVSPFEGKQVLQEMRQQTNHQSSQQSQQTGVNSNSAHYLRQLTQSDQTLISPHFGLSLLSYICYCLQHNLI